MGLISAGLGVNDEFGLYTGVLLRKCMLVDALLLTPTYAFYAHGFFSSIRFNIAVSQVVAFSTFIVHVPISVSFSKNFDP